MATVTENGQTLQIGEAAGLVWHTLNQNGPLSLAKLVKIADIPRDTVMQAVGWLAREDKVEFEETQRGRVLALKPETVATP